MVMRVLKIINTKISVVESTVGRQGRSLIKIDCGWSFDIIIHGIVLRAEFDRKLWFFLYICVRPLRFKYECSLKWLNLDYRFLNEVNLPQKCLNLSLKI